MSEVRDGGGDACQPLIGGQRGYWTVIGGMIWESDNVFPVMTAPIRETWRTRWLNKRGHNR